MGPISNQNILRIGYIEYHIYLYMYSLTIKNASILPFFWSKMF